MEIKESGSRLNYLDNLKVCLIILVIVHHAGQAYGPTGGFWPIKSSLHENMAWLGSFFRVNASFFMGLFFMISGYFFPTSYDKHGPKKFLQDKLRRFGLPLLFAFFVMMPAIYYFHYTRFSANLPIGYFSYFIHVYLGFGAKPEAFVSSAPFFPEWNFGALWFVELLLIFAIFYLLFRLIFPKFSFRESKRAPTVTLMLSMSVIIALLNLIVRHYYPHDVWLRFLGFIQLEPAHLPLYLIMFLAGIIACRKNWFQTMKKETGFIALIIGVLLAIVVYIAPQNSVMMKFLNESWWLYEAFLGIFLSWGLIILFREFFNVTNRTFHILAENSYAAYIFQGPIVIALQYNLDGIHLINAFGKFATVAILSVVITYLVSIVVRKIPYLKKIL